MASGKDQLVLLLTIRMTDDSRELSEIGPLGLGYGANPGVVIQVQAQGALVPHRPLRLPCCLELLHHL